MEQRKSRLIPESDLLKNHVAASVKHTTRGIVRQFFLAEHTMNAVYEWIVSLQELPMYFNLINFKGDILKPFVKVGDVKSVLNKMPYGNLNFDLNKSKSKFPPPSSKCQYNSLLPRINKLRYIAKLSKATVIRITELKLDNCILHSEIQIDNYQILRCDRN